MAHLQKIINTSKIEMEAADGTKSTKGAAYRLSNQLNNNHQGFVDYRGQIERQVMTIASAKAAALNSTEQSSQDGGNENLDGILKSNKISMQQNKQPKQTLANQNQNTGGEVQGYENYGTSSLLKSTSQSNLQ